MAPARGQFALRTKKIVGPLTELALKDGLIELSHRPALQRRAWHAARAHGYLRSSRIEPDSAPSTFPEI